MIRRRLNVLTSALLIACLLQLALPAARAAAVVTSVTVSAKTIPNWTYGGTAAKLRIYASDTFDQSGNFVIGSARGSGKWYQEISCTVAGPVLSIPSFTLYVTTTSTKPDASYTFVFVDLPRNTEREVYLSEIRVPDTLGATVTFSQLNTFSTTTAARPRQNDIYSKDQVNALLLAGVTPAAPAKSSTTVSGTLKSSVTPVDASDPIAIVTGDPRIGTAYNPMGSPYNALCDGSITDTVVFSSLLAAIGANAGTIKLPGARQCKVAGLTIPANVTIDYSDGGAWLLTTSTTLTIVGPEIGPAARRYYNATAGQGTVSYAGNKVLKEVSPEWWGPVGTANDAAVFQAAATAFKVVALQPKQSYAINSTVTAFNSSTGGKIIGNGASINTTLDGHLFEINLATNFEAYGLNFVGDYNYPVAALKNNQQAFTSNPCGTNIYIHEVDWHTMTGGAFFADGGRNVRFKNVSSTATLAEIQHGGGATTYDIQITDFDFQGSATLNMDDAIAISGSADGVIIANGFIDKKGSLSKTNISGEGVLIESSSTGLGITNVHISNVHIKNVVSTHVLQANTAGINIETGAGALPVTGVFINFCFVDGAYKGIEIGDGANVVQIHGGRISNTVNAGIRSDGVGAVVTVDGTEIVDAGDHGFAAQNAATLSLTRLIVTSAGNQGIFSTNTTGTTDISHNVVDGSTFDGIQSLDAKLIVAFNESINNGRYGLNLTSAVKPFVYGNKFSGNATAAINGYLGNVASVYRALVTQSGTGAPTASVLENSFSGTVVLARSGVGTYTLTLAGAFPAGKQWFSPNGIALSAGTFSIVRTSDNVLTITTVDDGLLTNFSLSVLVYP